MYLKSLEQLFTLKDPIYYLFFRPQKYRDKTSFDICKFYKKDLEKYVHDGKLLQVNVNFLKVCIALGINRKEVDDLYIHKDFLKSENISFHETLSDAIKTLIYKIFIS